jgi:hypothetical protein
LGQKRSSSPDFSRLELFLKVVEARGVEAVMMG